MVRSLGAFCLAVVCCAGLCAEKTRVVQAPAGSERLERYEFVQPHMGTLFNIVLFASDRSRAGAAAGQAFARVAELDRIMSDYNPDSELLRLARHESGTAVLVSFELFDILQRSQKLATLTGGAFDPTIGPCTRLWRQTRRSGELPSGGERALAMEAVGYGKMSLDAVHRTVTLSAARMQFDLGGIAKGYAADEALAVLRRLGFKQALVAAGGDLALGDPPPGEGGWKIEIPSAATAGSARIFVAANVGVSTSGDAEQFVEIDGVRYSHILDPKTGLGLTKPVMVTVVAHNATWSDGLATACSVLETADIEELLCRFSERAQVIVQRRDENGLVGIETRGAAPAGLIARSL